MSRRRTARARASICRRGTPAAHAAPISDPMLDPTTRLGTSPCSSSARSTPMWASPLRPPPLRTRVKGRSGFTRLPRLRLTCVTYAPERCARIMRPRAAGGRPRGAKRVRGSSPRRGVSAGSPGGAPVSPPAGQRRERVNGEKAPCRRRRYDVGCPPCAAEFPWTSDTIYLNNASIGPLPERTRLTPGSFNRRRAAPHPLPDREMFAMLADTRRQIARLIGAASGRDRAHRQYRLRHRHGRPRACRSSPAISCW